MSYICKATLRSPCFYRSENQNSIRPYLNDHFLATMFFMTSFNDTFAKTRIDNCNGIAISFTL